MDRRGDLAVAIAVIAYGLLIVALAFQMNPGLEFDALGSKGLPYVAGALIALLGVAIAWRRVRGWQLIMAPNDGMEDEPEHPTSWLRPLVLIVMTFAYLAALKPLGFVISTPFYMAMALWTLNERSWRQLITAAVLYTALMYLTFATFLQVPLPLGPLGSLLE